MLENYRPICSLPALYKLSTTVLCTADYWSQTWSKFNLKIRQVSDAHVRQWDHLTTCRMRLNKDAMSGEFKMWVATIDFTARRRLIPSPTTQIGTHLTTCGIEQEYINLLKRLQKNEKATVMTDKESDMFDIKKGTKQGGPLSSILLFNTVLQVALKDNLHTLAKEKKEWTFA